MMDWQRVIGGILAGSGELVEMAVVILAALVMGAAKKWLGVQTSERLERRIDKWAEDAAAAVEEYGRGMKKAGRTPSSIEKLDEAVRKLQKKAPELDTKEAVERVEAALQRLRSRGGGQSAGGAAAAIALLCALSTLGAVGCGGSATHTHAQAGAVSADVLREARTSIERECEAAERRAVAEHETREDAREAVDEVREHCDAAIDAYDAARATHGLYLEAVGAAIEAEDSSAEDALMRRAGALLAKLLATWRELSEAAEHAGITIPPPPDVVRSLGGAA